MKRNIVITIVFSAFALLMFFSSCTCYPNDDNRRLRGCGYECIDTKNMFVGCGMSCLGCIDDDMDVYRDYYAGKVFLAQEGVDYENFEAYLYEYQNETFLNVSIDILKQHKSMELKVEYVYLQDGVCVGEGSIILSDNVYTGISGPITGPGHYDIYSYQLVDKYRNLNKYYDENGGKIELIINSFSLTYED